jgi:lipoprotein-anchoring transpeptidase ErfK/SrfK
MRGRGMPRGAVRRVRVALLAACAVLLSGLSLASPMTARAAYSASTGGVVLDLFGGLHAFGTGTNINTAGAPYWPSWDMARAVAVLPDGSGGWTLDGWGGIHSWGSAPHITSPQYTPGWDIARGLVVLPDAKSGYLLDGFGHIHPFGDPSKAPAFAGSASWTWDIARGIDVAVDASGAASGGWVMDGFGGLHSFGSVPAASGGPAYYGRDVWQKLHLTSGGVLYGVGKWGVVSGTGLSPDWSGYSDWEAWNATRDVVLFSSTGGSGAQPVSVSARQQFDAASAPSGGVVLDLFGGLHPFGGYPLDSAGAPYWPNWDIARAAVVLPDGSGGWTLDGWGGIHNWGSAPGINMGTSWPGWDIARGLVVLPDKQSGYVLDGFGGLHAFGPDAPAFSSSSYTAGEDISRGVAVVTDPSGVATGGWVLGATGGLHPFGAVTGAADPVSTYPGHDVWQKLHLSLDGHLYGVGIYGIVSAPGISPSWGGYQDFGSWNAIRDVVIANPMSGGGQSQPVSAAAQYAFTVAASGGVIAKPGCGAYGWTPPAGKWIVLSLECQELSAYQDGQLLEDMLITTGRPALPTERGHTHVLSKNHPFLMISTWPRGSPYYYNPSWVQYVTWIWPNGTGIHDAYWEPNSGLGPGSTLGPYASHGCVHVTLPMAQWIYYWADVGTPVDVV